MPLSPEARQKTLDCLPRGYCRIVAERLQHRFSTAYVSMVATGKRENDEIEGALVKLAEETTQNAEQMEARAAAL